MTMHESHAGVPPQPRVVVARMTQRFGALEVLHRLDQPVVDAGAGGRSCARELRLGPPLGGDAGVVGAIMLSAARPTASRAPLWRRQFR
jgi:hypothetical protein